MWVAGGGERLEALSVLLSGRFILIKMSSVTGGTGEYPPVIWCSWPEALRGVPAAPVRFLGALDASSVLQLFLIT